MSLLMKALQQAAQNRGAPGSDPGATGPDAGSGGSGLSLEPIGPRESRSGAGADAWATASATGAGRAEPGRAASAARPPSPGVLFDSGSGMGSLTRIQWILLLGGLAGSLLGGYVYIEVNHPGLWHRGQAALSPSTTSAPPSPPPPASRSAAIEAAPPAPPMAPVAGTLATSTSPPVERPTLTAAPERGTLPGAGAAPRPARSPAPGATAMPSAASATVSPAAPAPAPAPPSARRPAEDGRRAGARAPEAPAPAEPGPGEPIRVTRSNAVPTIDPALAQGYAHLQGGRLDAAASAYGSVLAREPGSIDAQLGLAAVALARGETDAARQLYQRVLRAEPRNPWAQAGWLSLLAPSDPAAAEAQLRELVARDPSPQLWSRLGALLAGQGRWPQAQQAYFQAHSLQPDHPDHAFNLAVSLERIGQPRIALGFLRTAVRLAEAGAPARFDLPAARERIERLAEATGGRP